MKLAKLLRGGAGCAPGDDQYAGQGGLQAQISSPRRTLICNSYFSVAAGGKYDAIQNSATWNYVKAHPEPHDV